MTRATFAALLIAVWAGLRPVDSVADEPADLVVLGGKVLTLDGEPLAKADIASSPEGGRASFGTTDGAGRFELRYDAKRKGAVPGDDLVTIRTRGEIVDAEAEFVEERPALLPPIYHDRSRLTFTVPE